MIANSPSRPGSRAAALVLLAAALIGCDSPTPPRAVTRVDVSPPLLSLHPGETGQLTALTRSSDGATLTDRPVTWSSSDQQVATVSAAGLVTAVAPGGPVTVTATSEGVTGQAQVMVTPVPIALITLAPTSLTVEVGDTARLVATVRGAAGQLLTGRTLQWTSSHPSAATVSASGLVTGVSDAPTVTIAVAGEGVSASAPVTVVPAPVASMEVAPTDTTIDVGSSFQLRVTLRDARGAVLAPRPVAWASTNASVLSMSATGVVTGVAVGGPVTLTASSEGMQGSARVAVRLVPVARVQVNAASTEVNEGGVVQLTAELTDARGAPLAGRAVTWSSDSSHLATVDASGRVQTVRAGVARIRARSDGVEGSLDLTVRGLLHRWTFNEEGGAGTLFLDDLRSARASLVGGGTLAGSAVAGQVTLTGGARANADYLALPAGLLRGRSDATIEIWATLHTRKTWSRVFDVGSGPGNNLFVAWSQGTNATLDRVGFTVNGVEHRVDNSLAPFTIDLQHHLVVSIDEGGGSGGRTRIAVFLDGAPRGSFETSYRLRDLVDDNFWLGRSHHGDETANASYDEVRLHDRVYGASEVRQMFERGPIRAAGSTTLTIQPPAGMRDTVRGVGVKFPLRVTGQDALGRRFQVTGARWTSSNLSVATVDSAGVVQARTEGRTEVNATVSGLTARWTADVVRMRRLAVDPYLATPIAGAAWEVPVVLIEYLPTSDGFGLDTLKAPDFYWFNPLSLDSIESMNLALAKRRKMMVEQGSRFRGYRDAAALPSLGYRVVEHIIVYDQIPPHPTKRATDLPGHPRFEDWHAVISNLGLEPLLRQRVVREMWVAWSSFDGNFPSYKPNVQRLEDMRVGWESNMSSPTTGDISNSDRDNADAPVLAHTYIIYGINFRRSQAEAVHNVGHQVESMFSHVARRQDGNDRLFWRDFVGQDAQGAFITGRAGWTHMPPNTVGNYDYLNTALVSSDIEDWRPDNGGTKRQVNVNTWGALTYPWPGAQDFGQRVESQWYTYWFQNFPGRGNRIQHGMNWMTNWWRFVADWDSAIGSGLGLYAPTQAAEMGRGEGARYTVPADVRSRVAEPRGRVAHPK